MNKTIPSGAGNAKQYSRTHLKVVSGSLPKDIKGHYFRNGPSIMNYDNQVVQHWFYGDGCILKVDISNGQCYAQASFPDTPLHRTRENERSFDQGVLSKIWRSVK